MKKAQKMKPKRTAETERFKEAETSYRHIWALSWPVMLSTMSVPMAGAVDVAMMGHLPSPAYVGGVALGGLIFGVIVLSFSFLRMGTTGLTSRAAGAGHKQEISQIFMRSQLIALVGSILLILLHPFILMLALRWIETSPEAALHMDTYFSVRIWGLPATLGNAVMIGWLFGQQAMRLCMTQLIFINALNIAFNFLFVLGFGLDVDGVAAASAVSEWAGFILMIAIVRAQPKRFPLNLSSLDASLLFARDKWLAMLKIARDLSARTLLLWAVEALLLSQAASSGDNALAAIQIVLVIFGFIAFGLDGFAHATEALAGTAIGAGNRAKLILIIKRTTVLAAAAACSMSAGLYLLEGLIIPVMTSQAALQAAIADLWFWCVLIPPFSFLAFQMDGVYVGAAASHYMRNGMLVSFALFAGAVFFSGSAGLDGLMFAFIVYLLVRGIYLALYLGHMFNRYVGAPIT